MQGPLFQTCCSCILHFSGMVCTCVINVSTTISTHSLSGRTIQSSQPWRGTGQVTPPQPICLRNEQHRNYRNEMMIINEHIMYILLFSPGSQRCKTCLGSFTRKGWTHKEGYVETNTFEDCNTHSHCTRKLHGLLQAVALQERYDDDDDDDDEENKMKMNDDVWLLRIVAVNGMCGDAAQITEARDHGFNAKLNFPCEHVDICWRCWSVLSLDHHSITAILTCVARTL